MADVLEKIVAHKRVEIAQAKGPVSLVELEREVPDAPPVVEFAATIGTIRRSV